MITGLALIKGSDTISFHTQLSGESGFTVKVGSSGIGFVDPQLQWFAGAGPGASFQGGKLGTRVVPLQVTIRGASADELRAHVTTLERILDMETGLARAWIALDDGTRWWADVARAAGGDWPLGGDGTDGETVIRFTLTLESGDPYWTRETPEHVVLDIGERGGRSLLPKLANLRLTQSGYSDLGIVATNPGTVGVAWRATIQGPADYVRLISPSGEVFAIDQQILEGETIVADGTNATVVDADGNNRYSMTAPCPEFWLLPAGTSAIGVEMDGVSTGQRVVTDKRYNASMNPGVNGGDDRGWGGFAGGGMSPVQVPWSQSGWAMQATCDEVPNVLVQSAPGDLSVLAPDQCAASIRVCASVDTTVVMTVEVEVPTTGGGTVSSEVARSVVHVRAGEPTLIGPVAFQTTSTSGAGTATISVGADLEVDDTLQASEAMLGPGTYFDGDTPDSPPVAYTWEGTGAQRHSVASVTGTIGATKVTLEWWPKRQALV